MAYLTAVPMRALYNPPDRAASGAPRRPCRGVPWPASAFRASMRSAELALLGYAQMPRLPPFAPLRGATLDTAHPNDEIGAVSARMRATDSRRTFWGLAGDFFFFGVGASFAGQTTVVPSFLATLTQLRPAHRARLDASHGRLAHPAALCGKQAGRPDPPQKGSDHPRDHRQDDFALIAPAIVLLAPRSPGALLVAFYVLYFAFYFVDGLASMAWLDILGRCVPVQTRARLINLGTTAPGLAGIGAGVLVGDHPVLTAHPLALQLCAALRHLRGVLGVLAPFVPLHPRVPAGGRAEPSSMGLVFPQTRHGRAGRPRFPQGGRAVDRARRRGDCRAVLRRARPGVAGIPARQAWASSRRCSLSAASSPRCSGRHGRAARDTVGHAALGMGRHRRPG